MIARCRNVKFIETIHVGSPSKIGWPKITDLTRSFSQWLVLWSLASFNNFFEPYNPSEFLVAWTALRCLIDAIQRVVPLSTSLNLSDALFFLSKDKITQSLLSAWMQSHCRCCRNSQAKSFGFFHTFFKTYWFEWFFCWYKVDFVRNIFIMVLGLNLISHFVW